ncbi:MAG: hypothetical protein WCV69_01695 [Patescibacteria group bacterium]|jgi:uncharacterized membrane protein YcjF (UPF0283 family)
MAEVLQANYQRDLAAARRVASSSVPDTAEELDPVAEQEEKSQGFLRRRLESLRGKAKQQEGEKDGNVLQQQAEEKIKKEIAQKLTWRAVNMAMGATVILAFLTVLIWTVQFIAGNIFGSKIIPKLGMGEIILWLIGLLVIFTIFNMIMLGITLMVQVYENPLETLSNLSSIFWKVFWGILKGE